MPSFLTQFLESDFTLRTKEVYQHHVSALSGPLRDHNATAYGMWRESELNRLRYFHVTEGMVPDVMHDIFEGSLELCIRHMLLHFVSTKVLSLATLNDRIQGFKYGVDIRNKPTVLAFLTADKAIKQSGEFLICF